MPCRSQPNWLVGLYPELVEVETEARLQLNLALTMLIRIDNGQIRRHYAERSHCPFQSGSENCGRASPDVLRTICPSPFSISSKKFGARRWATTVLHRYRPYGRDPTSCRSGPFVKPARPGEVAVRVLSATQRIRRTNARPGRFSARELWRLRNGPVDSSICSRPAGNGEVFVAVLVEVDAKVLVDSPRGSRRRRSRPCPSYPSWPTRSAGFWKSIRHAGAVASPALVTPFG